MINNILDKVRFSKNQAKHINENIYFVLPNICLKEIISMSHFEYRAICFVVFHINYHESVFIYYAKLESTFVKLCFRSFFLILKYSPSFLNLLSYIH